MSVVRLAYHALIKRLEQQFGKNTAKIGIAETLAAPGMKVIQQITGCESAILQCAGASALVNGGNAGESCHARIYGSGGGFEAAASKLWAGELCQASLPRIM